MFRYSRVPVYSRKLFSTKSTDTITTSLTSSSSTTPSTIPPSNEKIYDSYCDPKNPKKLNFTDISSAAFNIRDGIIKTECRRSYNFSKLLESDIYFKMECNQVTGSFKERGARWALLNLSESDKKAGVWAASAGNHALALCLHGKQIGVPINVVMPRHAPLMKIDFCVQLGANVTVKGKDLSTSRAIAFDMKDKYGGTYINGYDHPDILAGAGTIGLELLDQVKDLDTVLVPVGGGGCIAGIACAIKSLKPNVKIIGIESETCPSFTKALEANEPTFIKPWPSLADGLSVPVVGCNALHTAKDYIDKMVLVNEQSIALGVLRLLEWEKIVVEGSGAIGIAALIAGQLPELKGKKIACICSGGNIDSTVLGRCIERGLVHDGRLARFKVVVSDRPGGCSELTNIVAEAGASIKDMFMERAWLRQDVFSVMVKVVAETRNKDHINYLESKLKARYEDVNFTQFDTDFYPNVQTIPNI